jgi:hypothetical protein
MNFFLLYFLIILYIKEFQGKSKEYYECMNPDKTVKSADECTKINIAESEGYKCCSMKFTFEKNTSYNCFALENRYTASQEVLNEYISKRNLASLFAALGGQMEIECGLDLKITKNYEKISNEIINCYNRYKSGVESINECNDNDIPSEENSKCCFVETSKIINNGSIINDKRCFILQNKYFTKEKNFSNYLLDESNIKSLDQIINTNITIKCKNC